MCENNIVADLEKGAALFQSAQNLRKSSKDLDALYETIWERLDGKRVGKTKIADFDREDDGCSSDWIGWCWAGHGKLRGEAEQRRGTISYLVRLCGSEDVDVDQPAKPWLSQACVIVGWQWDTNNVWLIEEFEASDADVLQYRDNGLWAYHDEDQDDFAFFYVLPLFALTSEQDIDEFILAPLQMLFPADDPAATAETALRGVPFLCPSPA